MPGRAHKPWDARTDRRDTRTDSQDCRTVSGMSAQVPGRAAQPARTECFSRLPRAQVPGHAHRSCDRLREEPDCNFEESGFLREESDCNSEESDFPFEEPYCVGEESD